MVRTLSNESCFVWVREVPAQKGLSSTNPAFRIPFKNLSMPGAGTQHTWLKFLLLWRLEKEPPTHPTVQGQWGKNKTKAGGKNLLAKFQQQIKWGLKERDELLKSVPIKGKAKTNWQYSAGFMSHCENGSPYTVGTYITYCNPFCPFFKSALLLSATKHAGVAHSLCKWVKAEVSGKRKFMVEIRGALVGDFYNYFYCYIHAWTFTLIWVWWIPAAFTDGQNSSFHFCLKCRTSDKLPETSTENQRTASETCD